MRGKSEGSIFKRKQDGYWVAQVTLPPRAGKRRRKTAVRKTKGEAVAALTDLIIELKKHGDLPTESQTVAQWFTYWLSIVEHEVAPKTFKGYKSTVNEHIIPTIGNIRLARLTVDHIRRVTKTMTTRDDKPLSSTTALLAHRVMSMSLTAAENEGRIISNPATRIKAPRKATPQLQALSLEEAIKVLEVAAGDRLGALWATFLFTGARRGEVIGLEVNRVTEILDLSWQLQRLPGPPGKPVAPADYEYRHLTGTMYLTRPKTKKGWRIIPLIDPLKSILERHLATSEPNEWGLLFTVDGKPLDPDTTTDRWGTMRESAGIKKNVRLHDVRHSTVDLLYEAGVNEATIQEIVGHSTRAQTQAYKSRGNRPELERAMRALSALFASGGNVAQVAPPD